MKKENIKYILLLIFFSLLLFLSPISGDDWGNYLEGSMGIKHMIGNAIGMYFNWEGRFISRILINFFTYYKPLWNIVNAVMIVGMIYYIVNIINPKNKKAIFLLTLLTILLMNIYTFSQVVVWIAGNITYLLVIPVMLYYFYHILRRKEQTKRQFFLFSILNIIMPMFIEHMGVVLVMGNFLILIEEYFRTKKLNKTLLVYLIFSIIGLSFMIFSPGSMKRNKVENPDFNKLSLLGKIRYNLPNFIYYTYIIYPYLILLMTRGNYFLLKKVIKNKLIKMVGYFYLLPLPMITTLIYLINNLKELKVANIINQDNPYIIIYFISYSIILLLLIYCYSKKWKEKKIIFFYLLGMIANLVMLISPTWGFRTSFGTYIFLSISYLLIIDKNINEQKWLNNLLLGITMIVLCFYSILYVSVARQNKENIQKIKEQKKRNNKVIEVIKYPSFINCNINPENDYHLRKFKEYYGIDSKVEIRLIENNWDYIIFYQK